MQPSVTLASDDLDRFRAALVASVGDDRGVSDDELREMIVNTLHLLRVARRLARAEGGQQV